MQILDALELYENGSDIELKILGMKFEEEFNAFF